MPVALALGAVPARLTVAPSRRGARVAARASATPRAVDAPTRSTSGGVFDRARAFAAAASVAAVVAAAGAPLPAFAEACQDQCKSECLKIAPGSGDYCASACEDECSAMKEENGGVAPEVEGASGAFGQKQNKGDFEQLLDKMLDTQKVFFVGPSANMKKAADK
jgi:hypothetical protein